MTQSFPSGESASDPITILQAKLSAASELNQDSATKLANQKIEIDQLYARLNQVTSAAEVAIAQMSAEKKELERNLRWANEGRDNAEKAEKRAKRELETYMENQDTGVSLGIPSFVILLYSLESN